MLRKWVCHCWLVQQCGRAMRVATLHCWTSQQWHRVGRASIVCCALMAVLGCSALALAEGVTLKDGRVLEGAIGVTANIAANPNSAKQGGAVKISTIAFVDDNLRRTYFPKSRIAKANEEKSPVLQKFLIPQRVALAGNRVARVGDIVAIGPFDEFGRRLFRMAGGVDLLQGITEITPQVTKLEGLVCQKPLMSDMRIATSSIPPETLKKILNKRIDPTKLDHRLNLVKFYVECERYQDAQKELEAVATTFPGQENKQVEIRALEQLHSRKVIDEILSRRKAGQHRLVFNMLQNFPKENAAGETLQQVREILGEYEETRRQGEQVLAQLKDFVAAINDPPLRKSCQTALEEIVGDGKKAGELNINTLDRMAAFRQFADDKKMSPDDHFSLGLSGWLLGSNDATTNLRVSLSLYEARNLARQYLTEPVKLRRADLLQQLGRLEGSSVGLVAKIVAHMKPPMETPPAEGADPGYHLLQVPGLDKEPDVAYHVQLPPEYDPYRRYPTVVTLNGAGTTPLQQLDWWAGSLSESGLRLGQAARLGYIVVAVDWAKPNQKSFEYTAREHAAVLSSLRDACRRFSIDTDRVFLSGHSMGGDAAWDIGLSHPDLWAGVIPIVAVADKYCTHYWENANEVPFYIVAGELDGDKMIKNSRDLDRYFMHRFDVTLTEYQGRGHEHFFDDIQRVFDWMSRRERNFFPKEFKVTSMRAWDNYFWWLELHEFPSNCVVDPINWPPSRGFQPLKVEAAINNNNVSVIKGSDKATIWLSPELVDFSRPIHVKVKTRRVNSNLNIEPSLSVLLEDVRTRGERLHPFWAKVE